MAYLHCHGKNCNWSQDDFWNYRWDWKSWKKFLIFDWQSRPFGYNPLSILLENIHSYIWPRKIKMDSHWAKENGLKSNIVFSRWFIKDGIRRYKSVKKTMLYETCDDFRDAKAKGIASCPDCGSKTEWDID